MYGKLLAIACDWVSKDSCSRKLEVKTDKGVFSEISLSDFDNYGWVYLVKNGVVLNDVNFSDDIDVLIDKLKVDRRREEYERLKKEFGEDKQ